ncbi:Autophagy-related protein 22-2 [Neolecta irregularis DAH-3]|uniref:Autophagy-related protein n=1 Tax=Neolecta irregularis (strain DAH-3) TaxID=1198029 RepID=A0A1U7LKS5_NEOID|nr:Autophagy-related protein 22-2 [Neolecta irregularis DAH-3]|eukprot:OLL23238.1 Autophagy-related protein 22-2 [Neolecta irregularis DAH-3]
MLFITVPRTWYILAGLLIIILNICFGSSMVCLNAFLPVLVRNYAYDSAGLFNSKIFGLSSVQSESPELDAENMESATLMKPIHSNLPDSYAAQLNLSSHISSQGIAIGLVSGIILQLICIPLTISTGSGTSSLQYAVFVSGLWWFIFTIPSMRWLKSRPGPPLPTFYKDKLLLLQYIQYGWQSLFDTIKETARLKDVIIFLVSWALLSDAHITISSSAILFAKTDLHIKPAGLIVIGMLSTLSGIVGAFTWSRYISPKFHLSPDSAIRLIVALSCLIPAYGLLGFIPLCRQIGFGGLINPIEIYFLALVYGFLNGALQGYTRAMFGSLIPAGRESGFFALYAITDKGSAMFGPVMVGIIIDKTHEIRWAFLLLLVMLGLSLLVMTFVNTQRGRQAARQ